MLRTYLVLTLALVACKPAADRDKDKAAPAEKNAAVDTAVGPSATLGAFTMIEADGPMAVDVTVGKAQAVATTCSDGPTTRVKLAVETGKLVITGESTSKCKVTLSAPTLDAITSGGAGPFAVHGRSALKSITLEGAGNIDVEAVETSSLALKDSGAGRLHVHAITATATTLESVGAGSTELSGTTGTLDVKIVGAGGVDAKQLVAESAKLELTGAGSATLDATRSADIKVVGVGHASVFGNPAEKKKSVVGVGSVKFE